MAAYARINYPSDSEVRRGQRLAVLVATHRRFESDLVDHFARVLRAGTHFEALRETMSSSIWWVRDPSIRNEVDRAVSDALYAAGYRVSQENW